MKGGIWRESLFDAGVSEHIARKKFLSAFSVPLSNLTAREK